MFNVFFFEAATHSMKIPKRRRFEVCEFTYSAMRHGGWLRLGYNARDIGAENFAALDAPAIQTHDTLNAESARRIHSSRASLPTTIRGHRSMTSRRTDREARAPHLCSRHPGRHLFLPQHSCSTKTSTYPRRPRQKQSLQRTNEKWWCGTLLNGRGSKQTVPAPLAA